MSMIDTPGTAALTRFLDLTAFRHSLISANLANIDTPGYRTVDIDFRHELERAAGAPEEAVFKPMPRPVQGLLERPDGNNVSMEREGLLLAETQLKFQTGVQLLRMEFHRLLVAIREGSQ